MNKYILGLILVLIAGSAISQNTVYFEKKGDTILFYLSCNGNLTSKDKATYKRAALFEKGKLAFQGNVVDYYYPDGNIALKVNYQNGFLDGRITNYYKNGAIKETGNYKNNNRDSIWTYCYKNQVVEKKIDYSDAQQKILEYYKKNGKPVFTNGNGVYKGYSNPDYSSCELYKIKGKIKDSVMVGRWTIDLGYSVCTEVFENGKFIRGYEKQYNRTYETASMINPSGFPYYENITLLYYLTVGNKTEVWPAYKLKVHVKNGFFSELEQKIKDNINTNDFFYALMEFQLENGAINTNSFKSITNDNQKYEVLKNLILSFDKWYKPKCHDSVMIYLPVFWENGLIYLKPNDIFKFNHHQ